MAEIFKLSASITAVMFVGYNILYAPIFKRLCGLSFMERLFISYGVGMGSLSLEMLLFYFAKAPFSLEYIFMPWGILFVINLIILRISFFSPSPFSSPPLGGEGRGRGERRQGEGERIRVKGKRYHALRIFLILGISFEVLYAVFRALIKPIESYDAIAIYAIKSKIFYLAGSIPAGFFQGLAQAFPHPDYPLNIPLAQTLVYLFLGNLNDQLVKIIFPLFFTGILVMLYYAIRRFASRAYALLFTFFLASVPQFNAYAANAYLDLPLAYYCFASAIFLFLYLENRKNTRLLVLSAVFAGLAGWTKNEGLMYCAINTGVIFLYFALERKAIIGAGALYIGIISLLSLPWALIKRSAHLVNADTASGGLTPGNVLQGAAGKLGPIIYEFQKQLFGPKKWNLIWFLALFSIIINYKKIFSTPVRYAAIWLAAAIMGYVFFYVTSPVEIHYFLSRTWSRFLIHFLPVVVYLTAYLLKEKLDI